MGKNTSISLGKHFEEFIQNIIESGQYTSASEVVRAALRMLEEHEQKKKALARALETGEQSGFVKSFDPDKLLEKLHNKHGVK